MVRSRRSSSHTTARPDCRLWVIFISGVKWQSASGLCGRLAMKQRSKINYSGNNCRRCRGGASGAGRRHPDQAGHGGWKCEFNFLLSYRRWGIKLDRRQCNRVIRADCAGGDFESINIYPVRRSSSTSPPSSSTTGNSSRTPMGCTWWRGRTMSQFRIPPTILFFFQPKKKKRPKGQEETNRI